MILGKNFNQTNGTAQTGRKRPFCPVLRPFCPVWRGASRFSHFFVPFCQEATGGVSRLPCERDGPNVALAAWSRRVPFLSRLRAAASMDWARLALCQPASPCIFLGLSAWVFFFLLFCEGKKEAVGESSASKTVSREVPHEAVLCREVPPPWLVGCALRSA